MAELEYGLFRVPYEHFQKVGNSPGPLRSMSEVILPSFFLSPPSDQLARNNHKVIQKHLQTSLIQAELIQTARSVSPEDGGPPIGEDVEIAGMSLVGKAEVLKSVQIMIQELEQLKKRVRHSVLPPLHSRAQGFTPPPNDSGFVCSLFLFHVGGGCWGVNS